MSWYDTILYPFEWVLAWIMVGINRGLVLIGFADKPGFTWILTIVLLTILVRAAVIPLYLKQIRSSRGMSVVQPEIKALREKYKGKRDQVSQQQMNQEVQKIYSEHGVNPMASCFPALIQVPVMMALYRVLWNASLIAKGSHDALGGFDQKLAQQMEQTMFFNSSLSSTWATGANHTMVIIAVVLYAVLMFAQQFVNYKYNMNTDPNDQQAKMMKTTMYIFPIMSAWFGFIVQMGVLIYLVITMVFSFLQQIFVIWYLPTPNSIAHAAMMKRNRKTYEQFKHSERKGYLDSLEKIGATEEDVTRAQRIKVKAVKKSDQNEIDPFENQVDSEKLKHALQIHTDYQAKLLKKAQDLELEKKPVEKRKPTRMQKFLEKQGKAAAEARGSGSHNPQAQPKRLTRAQREAQAKRRENFQKKNESSLSAEELEKRRQERMKQRREQKKNRRKRKN